MTPQDASDSRWSDLDRPPLNATALRRALLRPGRACGPRSTWSTATGSTNSDLAAQADAGAAEGAVLVAEEQTAGRGPPGPALVGAGPLRAVLLRPAQAGRDGARSERWGWLPLLTGVAVATGLSRAAGVDTALKWPNDLLVTVDGEERKAGGILAERAGDGRASSSASASTSRCAPTNCRSPARARSRSPDAVSTDRDTLLRAVLRSLERLVRGLARGGGRPGGVRGSRRRTRRAARRWAARCGRSCPGAGR